VCSFDPFIQHDKSENANAQKRLEYPPPILLVQKENSTLNISREGDRSQVIHWWTLGVIIYEMLTGLPHSTVTTPQRYVGIS
jgi:hypothetical protein